jgi:hypothetical protein
MSTAAPVRPAGTAALERSRTVCRACGHIQGTSKLGECLPRMVPRRRLPPPSCGTARGGMCRPRGANATTSTPILWRPCDDGRAANQPVGGYCQCRTRSAIQLSVSGVWNVSRWVGGNTRSALRIAAKLELRRLRQRIDNEYIRTADELAPLGESDDFLDFYRHATGNVLECRTTARGVCRIWRGSSWSDLD